MSEDIPPDVPFSLSCTDCDADSPDSYQEAIAEGWTGIEFFPEGIAENFLGICPDCRRRDEEEARRLSEKSKAKSNRQEPT